MDLATRLVLIVHVISALVAVAAFWAAFFLAKGSRLHLRAGRLYVRAMLAMTGTAAVLSAEVALDPLLLHPELDWATSGAQLAAARELGIVLFPTALVMASITWQGARAVGRRKARGLRDRLPDVAVAAAMFGIGASASWIERLTELEGVAHMDVPLVVVGGIQMAGLLRTSPQRWLREHIIAIGLSGTFLHAALLTQVGARLVPGLEGADVLQLGGPALGVGILATLVAVSRYAYRPRPMPDRGLRPLARTAAAA